MTGKDKAEVIVIGGGIAGLSAAIYLGRAERDVIVIDSAKSMAVWEPDVQNYLGFPEGVAGKELLRRGREQAQRYHVNLIEDEIHAAHKENDIFVLKGGHNEYFAKRLLIATGIFHIPPKIEGVSDCLGHSMFFCKDCDGFRVRGKRLVVYGWSNEAVEYALSMLFYSASVVIVTGGKEPGWDGKHERWILEYNIPVLTQKVASVKREGCQVIGLVFGNGMEVNIDALFTTKGDICYNKLAKDLGAEVDEDGQILVDLQLRTTVHGLYAAGCVTPANCQMIIAAGQGATAAQSINRDLFEESLVTHSLRRFRSVQLQELVETGDSKDRKTLADTLPATEHGHLGVGIEASMSGGDVANEGGAMKHIEKSIEVEVPLQKVYNQWTQFEEFPEFMEGVEEVQQLDDRHLHWVAEIGGKKKEWDAEIYEQIPDQRVAWRSTTGARNSGAVEFRSEDQNRTRVTLKMDYEPEGALEKAGDAVGAVGRRIEGDLERFKDFMQKRKSETGAWRGEIHD